MRLQQSSSFLSLLVLVFFFVVVISNEVSAIRINVDKSKNLASYEPIKDLSDPHIQELGKYSVDEGNRLGKTSLKYDHLVSGKSRHVQGTKFQATDYLFVINAIDGSVKKNYEAVLWDWDDKEVHRTLFEFHEITETY